MQLRDWLTGTAAILLLKQESCNCIGEIMARLKQQGQRRSTQYVRLCLFTVTMFRFLIVTRLYEERL